MLISWSDGLSVGHPAIDAEHRVLATLINDLHDTVLAGRGREAEGTILHRLVEHTVEHFGNEERLMATSRFPGAAVHTAEHEHLLRVLCRFVERFENGCPLSTNEILHALVSWLEGHLMSADLELSAHLASHQVAA